MDRLAEKYNKTKAQIAINWLTSKKNIFKTPKSTNIEHLKENQDAFGWNLSSEDIQLLDKTKF
ncbi:MAG: aldo/keto reductase [DPANN group archaeon]|nr:aldo/keto reductase [DPANN group archaeon]